MSDPHGFISFAQHGEDVILWRALGDRGSCFYVDVGAFDPSDDSVTRALYERGWRGINLEPQPDRLAAFEEARPEDINLSIAIGDSDGTATLRLPPNPGWATLQDTAKAGEDSEAVRSFTVPIRRLDTLLPELAITHVDVLKIDVEGTEPAVVRGLLGGPIRPLVCVVEGVAPAVGRTAGDEAVALLVEAGYLHCLFDGLNHYLTIDAALQPALSIPANPLDEYSRVAMVDLERERKQLIATIETLGAENLGLREAKAAAFLQVELSLRDPRESSDARGTRAERTKEQAKRFGHERVPKRGDLDPRALDRVARSERRRVTFQKLIRVEPARSLNRPSAANLLSLAVTDLPPIEAVSVLYRTVLGRDPDPEGLARWADRLSAGDPLLEVARELARSPEATDRLAADRARVQADLVAWESVSSLRELGVSIGAPDHTYSPGRVRLEIFVEALFEVALERRPTPDEVRYETDMLIAGGGREWLMRAYAYRPEVRARFLGTRAVGLRGKLRRWLNGRRYFDIFRELVVAAEARQINYLLARLTAIDSVRVDRVQASARAPEESS